MKSLHCQKSYVTEFIPLELCEAQNTSLLCFTFNGLKRLCYHLDSKRSMLRIHQDLKIYWNFCIVTWGHIIRQLFPSPCEQMFCFHSGLYEKHIAPPIWRLHRFWHYVKSTRENVTKMGLIFNSYLAHPYFCFVPALGLHHMRFTITH